MRATREGREGELRTPVLQFSVPLSSACQANNNTVQKYQGVTTQMNATDKCFLVELFIMSNNMVLTYKSS